MAKQETYRPDWIKRTTELLDACAEYQWLIKDRGSIHAVVLEDVGCSVDPIVCFANIMRERRNNPPLGYLDWDIAAEELGFSQYEAMVMLTTFSLSKAGLQEMKRNPIDKYCVPYWNEWLRRKAEEILLQK